MMPKKHHKPKALHKTLNKERKEQTYQEEGRRSRRAEVSICSAYRKQQMKKQEAYLVRAKLELESGAKLNIFKCRICRWYHLGTADKRHRYKEG